MGWGRKHATVDYVFNHPYYWLAMYHFMIMAKLQERGYKIDKIWYDAMYRGKSIGIDTSTFTRTTFVEVKMPQQIEKWVTYIYPEHDDQYLDECIENLSKKGISINREKGKSR
jgi:uncharacterized protein (TIGR02328 family)